MRYLTVVILSIMTSCGRPVDNYIIKSGTPYGWVVIDSSRQDCPPVQRNLISRETVVPPSRYVCTASPVLEAAWQRYFLQTGTGEQKPLKVGEMIRRPSRMQTRRSNGWPCDVDAVVFYYGPTIPVRSTPDAVLERQRPDCKPLVVRAGGQSH